MQYIEYPLTDLGYYVDALGGPGDITGLSNQGSETFHHLGVVGAPIGAVMYIDTLGAKTKTLAIFEDGASIPGGGTAVLSKDVADLLVSDYGWPAGTSLGVGGLPVQPPRPEY